jgi:outer membrane protein assembly factor BamB
MVAPHEVLEARRAAILRRRRLTWLIALGVFCLLIAILLVYQFTEVIYGVSEETQSAPQNGEWTTFHRDLARTGNVDTNGVSPGGTLKWTFITGGAIHSSPAVIDGTLYIGSRDSYIYALDAETGERLWAFKTGSWVESSPVVVNGVVYCGSNDGNLYALNARTGEKVWAFSTSYAIRSTPAVADGVVYIGTDDYYVYAVDAATGTEVWRKKTENYVLSSPVVSKGIVAVGSVDGIFYTFNAKSGKSRLKYDTKASIVSSPAVKDGVAYITDTRGFFWAINIAAKNWLFENRINIYWNALYIYGIAPRPPKTSGFLWDYWLGWGVRTSSSPAVVDNNAYLGAGNSLISLDLTTQEVQWTFNTGNTVISSPAVTGAVIYFGGQDGNLYALDRATGEKLWEGATGGEITSSPAVANGTVYVGSHDGKVYAFK